MGGRPQWATDMCTAMSTLKRDLETSNDAIKEAVTSEVTKFFVQVERQKVKDDRSRAVLSSNVSTLSTDISTIMTTMNTLVVKQDQMSKNVNHLGECLDALRSKLPEMWAHFLQTKQRNPAEKENSGAMPVPDTFAPEYEQRKRQLRDDNGGKVSLSLATFNELLAAAKAKANASDRDPFNNASDINSKRSGASPPPTVSGEAEGSEEDTEDVEVG